MITERKILIKAAIEVLDIDISEWDLDMILDIVELVSNHGANVCINDIKKVKYSASKRKINAFEKELAV